jgi:hypothetical protein
MNVAAIMPCRGRAEQTVRNVRRLLATAGNVDWELICACDGDDDAYGPLLALPITVATWPERRGYWRTLATITQERTAPLLVNLANDLLPGQHWLQRAVAAYQATFGDGPGLLGFNDGHHQTEHSCHFLISRTLLDDYGGWPVWYDHTHGDTELCQRAIADGLYAKAPWATLYHDHPYFGGDDDAVYVEGRMKVDQDSALFQRRKMNGWRS